MRPWETGWAEGSMARFREPSGPPAFLPAAATSPALGNHLGMGCPEIVVQFAESDELVEGDAEQGNSFPRAGRHAASRLFRGAVNRRGRGRPQHRNPGR